RHEISSMALFPAIWMVFAPADGDLDELKFYIFLLLNHAQQRSSGNPCCVSEAFLCSRILSTEKGETDHKMK
ncbi:hypothetical protein AVEN_191763-1, partial [Araneus ventricosus]